MSRIPIEPHLPFRIVVLAFAAALLPVHNLAAQSISAIYSQTPELQYDSKYAVTNLRQRCSGDGCDDNCPQSSLFFLGGTCGEDGCHEEHWAQWNDGCDGNMPWESVWDVCISNIPNGTYPAEVRIHSCDSCGGGEGTSTIIGDFSVFKTPTLEISTSTDGESCALNVGYDFPQTHYSSKRLLRARVLPADEYFGLAELGTR